MHVPVSVCMCVCVRGGCMPVAGQRAASQLWIGISPHHWGPVCPRACYSNSLGLSFPICSVGMLRVKSAQDHTERAWSPGTELARAHHTPITGITRHRAAAVILKEATLRGPSLAPPRASSLLGASAGRQKEPMCEGPTPQGGLAASLPL